MRTTTKEEASVLTQIQPCPAFKKAPANLSGAVTSCEVQWCVHISIAPSRRLVWIGALAQQQQRQVPGFRGAGKAQWRQLGRNFGGEPDSPLC